MGDFPPPAVGGADGILYLISPVINLHMLGEGVSHTTISGRMSVDSVGVGRKVGDRRIDARNTVAYR